MIFSFFLKNANSCIVDGAARVIELLGTDDMKKNYYSRLIRYITRVPRSVFFFIYFNQPVFICI